MFKIHVFRSVSHRNRILKFAENKNKNKREQTKKKCQRIWVKAHNAKFLPQKTKAQVLLFSLSLYLDKNIYRNYYLFKENQFLRFDRFCMVLHFTHMRFSVSIFTKYTLHIYGQ